MGRQHIRDGVLHIRQQKTGTELAIPIHPELQQVLDETCPVLAVVGQQSDPTTTI